MRICTCGQQAVVEVGLPGERITLCMNCYDTFTRISERQIRILEAQRDQVEREIHETMGLPIPSHLQPKNPIIMNDVKNTISVTGGNVGIINTGKIQQANGLNQERP